MKEKNIKKECEDNVYGYTAKLANQLEKIVKQLNNLNPNSNVFTEEVSHNFFVLNTEDICYTTYDGNNMFFLAYHKVITGLIFIIILLLK